MTTALQLIEDAYDDIEVKSSEVDLSTSEINNGIRRLNRLATQLATAGLNFGYTIIIDDTDTVTIPDWSEDLFVTLLGIRMAPGFGRPIPQSLEIAAADALAVARRALSDLDNVPLPCNLPVGVGNTQYGDNVSDFFTDTSHLDLVQFNTIGINDGEGDDLSVG